MAELNALSTEDRVAIDRVFERLSGRSHYEVLAVAPDSSWEAISQALRDLPAQPRRLPPRRYEHSGMPGKPAPKPAPPGPPCATLCRCCAPTPNIGPKTWRIDAT